jgi:hypothetical protein
VRRILRNLALPVSGERCSPGRLPRGPIKQIVALRPSSAPVGTVPV